MGLVTGRKYQPRWYLLEFRLFVYLMGPVVQKLVLSKFSLLSEVIKSHSPLEIVIQDQQVFDLEGYGTI